MKRALLACALLGCAALLAGFSGQGASDFGRLGAGFGRPGNKPATGCSNAMIFNVACNSQYEIIIH